MTSAQFYVLGEGYRKCNVELIVREEARNKVIIVRIQELELDIELGLDEAKKLAIQMMQEVVQEVV